MTARASNRYALLAAERLAPYQLQLAHTKGQRDAANQAATISALDKIIAAAGTAPGQIDAALSKIAEPQAAAALARLQGKPGGLEPEPPTTAEGPAQLITPPPIAEPYEVPVEPLDVPARDTMGVRPEGPAQRAAVEGPPEQRVTYRQPSPYEVPPDAPAPRARGYAHATPYDEAVAALDEAIPTKAPTGNWWDDLLQAPGNEIAKRAREKALLPAAKEVAQEREKVVQRDTKTKADALEQMWLKANYDQRGEHNAALEKQAAAALNATGARQDKDIASRETMGEARLKQDLEIARMQNDTRLQVASLADETRRLGKDLAAAKAVPQDVRNSITASQANIDTLGAVVNDLRALRQQGVSVSGLFDSTGHAIAEAVPGLKANPTLTKVYARLAAIRNVLANREFGAAFSPSEQTRFDQQFPSWYKIGNDDVFVSRIEDMYNEAVRGQSRYIETLNSSALTARPVVSPTQQPGAPGSVNAPAPTPAAPAPGSFLGKYQR